ncbi:hypothetical protein ALQ17_05359, partial [Pseudomonas fluorescens]
MCHGPGAEPASGSAGTQRAHQPAQRACRAGIVPELIRHTGFSQQRANPQLLGHGECDVLFAASQFIGTGGAPGVQLLDNTAHQHFRGRSTRRDANALDAIEPAALHVFGTVDQVRRRRHALSQLTQAVGVGTVGAADHQDHIAFVCQLLDRVLAVLGGVADVVLARAANGREATAQRVDHAAGVVHGQGGLSHECQALGVLYLQAGDVFFVFHQVNGPAIAGVVLTHGAFDFRVAGVADQDALATITAVARDFDVHLGDQWAGSIEDFQAAACRFGTHRLGNTVGAEDDDHIVRYLIQLFDKDGAAGAQVFDHEFVVDDFMTHVNRRPEDFQGAVDDFDRPVHTGAEATGVGEFDLHAVPRVLQLFGSGVTLTQPKMKIKGGRGGAT